MFNKILVFAAFFLLSSLKTATAQNNEYVEELRGVWITNVDSDVLNSKQKIADAMDYLAERGFNVVYPVVWNKGYTLFPSEVAQDSIGFLQDPVFANQNRDPLAEIIVEAHRVGIEVIPWFEYGFASVFGDPSGGHILQANPHWASKDVDGNIANRNNFYWMNAIHPFVQEFMLGIMEEAILNYDIDGVQGDDRLPAMSSTAGYSDFTKQLYREEHNGEDPPSQHDDTEFLRWKADKLTVFAGDLYNMVKDNDPNLTVSLSPSIYSFSYDNYLQDWPTWLDSAYVDILHPQNYRYDIGSYKQVIRNMLGQQPFSSQGYIHRFYRPQIYPGVLIKAGGTFNDDEYVLEAIDFNREYDLKGEVYFFYEGLDEKNDDLADSLYKYEYYLPALPPHRNGKVRRPKAEISNENDASTKVTGTWSNENAPEGFEGSTLIADANSGSTLEYEFDVPYQAWYRIYAWIPDNSSATKSANYQVFGMNDTSTTVIDQSLSTNGGWKKIGNALLEEGKRTVVKIDADKVEDNKSTYADAMMLLIDRKKSPDVEVNAVIVANESELEVPDGFKLEQNYPNPFNPSTSISFTIPNSSYVTLEVFDVLGRKVSVIESDAYYSSGTHTVSFNASNLASGVYLYRFSTNSNSLSKKMVLIK